MAKLPRWATLTLMEKVERLIWLHGSTFPGSARFYYRCYRQFRREQG